MALRIVAGDRCGKWRLLSAREPIGSAVSTYSRMMAIRTSRWRASTIVHTTALPGASAPSPARRPGALQQLDEEGVGDEEAGLRQPGRRAVHDEVAGVRPGFEAPGEGRVLPGAPGQPR